VYDTVIFNSKDVPGAAELVVEVDVELEVGVEVVAELEVGFADDAQPASNAMSVTVIIEYANPRFIIHPPLVWWFTHPGVNP